MFAIIKKEDFREGIPLANSNDLSLEDCVALTHVYYWDFDESNNYVEVIKNCFIDHEDFETVQEYIDFYDQNGFLFVIL